MGSRSGKRLTTKEKAKHRQRLESRRRNAPWRGYQTPVPPEYKVINNVLRSHIRGILGRQNFDPDLLQVQGLEYVNGCVAMVVRVVQGRQARSPTVATVFRMELANPALLDKLEEFLLERIKEAPVRRSATNV